MEFQIYLRRCGQLWAIQSLKITLFWGKITNFCHRAENNPISLFQFRAQVHKFVLKSPCFKEEKKGLENCHKSQSFFTGINLMPTNGGEKSQTMSTTIQDSTRVSFFILPPILILSSTSLWLTLTTLCAGFCQINHQ